MDVRPDGGSQLPFITLLGPIDITDWYSAATPPSKDPPVHGNELMQLATSASSYTLSGLRLDRTRSRICRWTRVTMLFFYQTNANNVDADGFLKPPQLDLLSRKVHSGRVTGIEYGDARACS